MAINSFHLAQSFPLDRSCELFTTKTDTTKLNDSYNIPANIILQKQEKELD